MSSYDEFLDPDRDIWDLFWIIPLFLSLEKLETIEKKLRIPHDEKKDALLSGFKLVLRVIFRAYLQYTFRDNDFLKLTEDWTTRRAFFYGLHAEKMPPSCEKAIRVQEYRTNVRSSLSKQGLYLARTQS